MFKWSCIVLSTVLLLALAACTVNVSQPSPPAQVQSPQPTNSKPASSKRVQLGSKIPITWASENLSGKLVFLNLIPKDPNSVYGIQELDLATGDLRTLFTAPDSSWIYTLAVSPDGKQLIFAYTPPANGSLFTQALYRMPMDGSKPPEIIFAPPAPEDQYLHPSFSPDGLYLYYVHTNYKNIAKDQHYSTFEIYRMPWPDGKPALVAEKAFWPRLSADNSKLVYISSDPITGKNKIYTSAPDGSNSIQVPLSGDTIPDIIDAPVFSPDGQSIFFSAPPPQKPASSSWIDRLLGVTVAEAHSVPSELWKVPISGGIPVQLTHIQAPGFYTTLSPDLNHFASFASTKIFVMGPDAGNLILILDNLGGVNGSISWIP